MSRDLDYNTHYCIGKSLKKVIEMIARDETGDFFHYPSFLEADKHFINEELCYMSNFTQNYLKAISYDEILEQRIANYKTLFEGIEDNDLNLDGIILTYMFPVLSPNGIALREYLKENNIYSQILWPNVQWNGASEFERKRSEQMVLLPIDQRYSLTDMEYIVSVVNNFNKQKKLSQR